MHSIYTKLLVLVCLLVMSGGALAKGNCPRESFASKVRQADLIMLAVKKKHDFVGYKRAGLKYGQEDEYAAKHKETPLWKWKINEFEVEKVFKGSKQKDIRLVSARNFSTDGRYIVFAKTTKGQKRFSNTLVPFVNEKCDSAEFIYPMFGSGLLDDVEDYFSKAQFK